MRIVFVISSLGAGGAERVMSIMANYWADTGKDITIATFTGENERPFYPLSQKVKHAPLGIDGNSNNIFEAIYSNARRIIKLRNTLKKLSPDLIISFIDTTNVSTILATRGMNIPVVVSEHNNPKMFDIGHIWRMARNLTYPLADKVVLLSERLKSCYSSYIQSRAVIIPNPVVSNNNDKEHMGAIELKSLSVVAMGRFGHEKGFDMLIKAFARAISAHPDWSLIILGDGKLRPELEKLRDDLGLQDKVSMPGIVHNASAYLNQADIFVLSSRYEAFPMSLCEAMAAGTAVISYDCESGPGEIITDGVDGILVPSGDTRLLGRSIGELMEDANKRNALAKSAMNLSDKYSVRKIMGKWEDLLLSLIKSKS